MFDVIEVVLELDEVVVERAGVVVFDLRPSRQSRTGEVSECVIRHALSKLRNEFRTLGTRPDERHVAFEDVPDLREFVDPSDTEEPSYFCNARIVFDGELSTVHFSIQSASGMIHGSEFDDLEVFSVFANAFLSEEQMTLGGGQHEERHEWRESDGEQPERDGKQNVRPAFNRLEPCFF